MGNKNGGMRDKISRSFRSKRGRKDEGAATPGSNVRRAAGKMSDMADIYEVSWGDDGKLGSGHYATVYRGKNKTTKEGVAVKRIKRSLTRLETLRSEVEALRAVKGHPNIVGLHDVFYDDDYVVIVLELLDGGELFDRIVSSGAYSEQDASQHIAKIAKALAYMHHQGIVHRDLKPENLVLKTKDPDSDITISDFGLSKILKDDQITMKTVCGTRAYSAPEVNFGGSSSSTQYTDKVDMWSVGVILYVILAAYHPFDPYGDSNDRAIWSKICSGKWDFDDPVWEAKSPEAKDLLTKLICVDPQERFSAEQMLEHPWITKFRTLPSAPLPSASKIGGSNGRSLMNFTVPKAVAEAADQDIV